MSFLFQKCLIALLYFYVCVRVIYFFMCVCVLIAACVCVCVGTPWCVWEWVRGQPAGVAVLLTPYGSQGLNSGSHAWKQAPYELQLSSQPPKAGMSLVNRM